MTSTITRQATIVAAEPVPFPSAEAARRFERRALTVIRHATRHGLFTAQEASRMVDRVYALTVETIALLTMRAHDTEVTRA